MIDSAVSLSCEQDNACYKRKPNKLQRRHVPSRSNKTDASFTQRFLDALKKMSPSNEKQNLKSHSDIHLGPQERSSGQSQSINDHTSGELNATLSGSLTSSTIRKITQLARRHNLVESPKSSTTSGQPRDAIYAIQSRDDAETRLPTRAGSISSRRRYTISSSRSLPLETTAPTELPLDGFRNIEQTDVTKPMRHIRNRHRHCRLPSDVQGLDLALQDLSHEHFANSKVPIRIGIGNGDASAIDCLAAVIKLHTLSESLVKQQAVMKSQNAHHCSDDRRNAFMQTTKTPFPSPEGCSMPFQSSMEGQTLATSRFDSSARTPVIISQSGGLTISRPFSKSQSLESTDFFAADTHSHVQPEVRSRQKKYPPRAFPVDFYERFPDPDPLFPYGVINLDTASETSKLSEAKPEIEEISNISSCVQTQCTQDVDSTSVEQSTFYETIHWFTNCPHASPPATRPLNSQPYPDPSHNPNDSVIQRSIIDGACFACDSQQRRDDEDHIVDKFTLQLDRFANQLSLLIGTLEVDNAAIDLEVENEALNSNIANAIRILEEEIEHLRDMEDREVKAVWAGYTARWGPATLGIQRSLYRQNSTEDDWPLRRDPENDTRSTVDASVRAIPSDADAIGNNETQLLGTPKSLSQTESSQGSRTVSSSSRTSESSNGTSVSPGEGRMKIDWIRPDKE